MEKSRMKLWMVALGAGIFSASPARAELSGLSVDDLKVSGYSDAGRFQLKSEGPDGEIISRVGARWMVDKPLDEHWSAMAALHWMFWRNQRTDLALFHIAGLKFDSDVQAALSYAKDSRQAKIGLYDFKYNPDARNLGEYLLRSEAYPTFVENSQGKDLLKDAYSKVAGVEYGLNHGAFRHKALLYAEQEQNPVNDLNLVYLASYGTQAMEVGAGVAWARFAKFGDKIHHADLDSGKEFASLGQYVKDNGLTTEAVKFSVRGRVDIGALLQHRESIVLYAEAALLGLDNDTLYYKDMLERVPMMAGISFANLGTGNITILSSLAVEGEYFKNPYYDQKYPIQDANGGRFTPLPYLPTLDDYSALPNNTRDDWKWSVTAERNVGRWINLKVRAASDHMRLRNWDGDYEGGGPLTTSAKDWYFLARIEFHN
jgi:hypothetical protein